MLNDAKRTLARDTKAGAPDAVIAGRQGRRLAGLALARERAAPGEEREHARRPNQVAAAKLGVRSANLAYTGATDVDTTALVEADRAAVVQAEGAAAATRKETLALATITAPIDGIVSSVDIRPGDVASGTVIRLRSAAVEVTASVTESDLPRIAVGQPVDVTVSRARRGGRGHRRVGRRRGPDHERERRRVLRPRDRAGRRHRRWSRPA